MRHKKPMATPLSRLAHKKTEYELLAHKVNSMLDDNFLEALEENDVRTIVVTASLREDNIATYRREGTFCFKNKDVHSMKKLADRKTIIDNMHSMDDNSLLEFVKDPALKELALSNMSLSQRLAESDRVGTIPVARVYKHSPIPFRLEL